MLFFYDKIWRRYQFYTRPVFENYEVECYTTTLIRSDRSIHHRVIKVGGVHGDGAFNHDSLEQTFLPAKLYVYSKNEHVGIIKPEHHMVKYILCSVTHSLPYTFVTFLMIFELVRHVVDMTNRQPSVQGNYGGMTSAEIVKGIGRLDMAKKQIKFGAYAKIWGDTTNTMKERSVSGIALSRANEHGG